MYVKNVDMWEHKLITTQKHKKQRERESAKSGVLRWGGGREPQNFTTF